MLEVGLRLDPATHRATIAGKNVDLGPTEFICFVSSSRDPSVSTRAQLWIGSGASGLH
jgi:hypothetical protein